MTMEELEQVARSQLIVIERMEAENRRLAELGQRLQERLTQLPYDHNAERKVLSEKPIRCPSFLPLLCFSSLVGLLKTPYRLGSPLC